MIAVLKKATWGDSFRERGKSYEFNFYGKNEEGTLNIDSNRFLHDPNESADNYDFEIEIKIKAIRKQSNETTLQ